MLKVLSFQRKHEQIIMDFNKNVAKQQLFTSFEISFEIVNAFSHFFHDLNSKPNHRRSVAIIASIVPSL